MTEPLPETPHLPVDHPLNGPDGPARMREWLRTRPESYSDRDVARARMAQVTRQAIAELLSTTAGEDDLVAAADLVERAVELLASRPHGRPYEGRAEGSLREGSSFVDHSPFVGAMNPLAPPIEVRVEDDIVVGTVTFGPPYEGPPGCVHGGFIAAAFDELLGFTQSMSGTPGMTARLQVDYRSPTPLLRELRLVGRLTGVDGRKIHTAATLHHGDTLCAEATGLFVSMKPEVFSRLLAVRVGGAGQG